MFQFTKHTGVVVPLNISNIDTDLIIPKQFLQGIDKIGLGKYLFYDWRYLDGNEKKINKDFILNKKIYKNATILLTKENFGCGSSREHAVWSLLDFGFRVIIASSFSDIFYNNSFNNKLLLIILEKKIIELLFNVVEKDLKIYFTIDLINKKIIFGERYIYFKIDDFRRSSLLNDLDNVDYTMKFLDKIKMYENKPFNYFLKKRKFLI